ncbi:non-ribosomal peptide synthetase [Nocardia caishijiensis]|uniref:Mycobactin peptide synthetase MbtF n=1 Tax=Nocardia caishijiensis TaxID=184756 RepID=A0ABQ6YRB2_9NOCA|nr:non-ribosomal peptide synthetase [Nocardia caishijiensis]KAF0848193.1 mycobactin peptide synthetase MbtF [Nocardia caishijiensis]
MSAPQIEDVLALSPLQEGLFSLSRMAGAEIDLYTMQFVVDIDGPLDPDLLRRSAQAMLDRHPNLRAAFWDTDVPKPVQIIPSHAELPWAERDATTTEFQSIAESERRVPFTLSRGPALRILLLNVTDAQRPRKRMILTAHHILMDGWAVAVFFTELLAVYQAGGRLDGLPAPRPYRDYIGWLGAQDHDAAARRWAEYLGQVSAPLVLADGAGTRGSSVPETTRLRLSAPETELLQQWARANGMTLNTAVQFAWTVLLGRITDRTDVVYGTTISGRPEKLTGVEGMVGLFINTVPVVHRLAAGEPIVAQCARLQRDSSAMRDIGYLSLSTLQRAAGQGALFDTLFVFENAPIDDALEIVTAADGAQFRPIEMESLAHYPLTVVSHLSEGELLVLVEAVPALLGHLDPADLGARLVAILRTLPALDAEATLDAIDLLTPAEHAELARAAADRTPAPSATPWELFERQVASTPDATALTTTGGEHFTYRELHDNACRLGAEFAANGVGPETVVALMLPRGTDAIITILATFAAGAAYVPVDITLPVGRIESILRQSNPVLAVVLDTDRHLLAGIAPQGVLPGSDGSIAGAPRSDGAAPTSETESASASLGAELSAAASVDPSAVCVLAVDDAVVVDRIANRPAQAPAVLRELDHAAYIIFTSGSTGEPKGVVGTNAALAGYFADHLERFYRPAMAKLGRPLRIAHAWSLGFDASWQPMVGFFAGQALHLFDAEEMRDAHRIVSGMAEFDIDMIDTTPSMLAQLAAAGLLDRELSVLALGGEAIDTALWARLRALPGTAVYNCYGPTETTVEAVVAPVATSDIPTIGTANGGMVGYVLDSRLRPVPPGIVGELYLSGVQLARGYLGKPAITADRFVADPTCPGQRMYRTGDLVRRLPGDRFGYLGRADAQVKVRGYRIEVGEIETALRRSADIDTAAVTVVRRAGGASLVGFVVGKAGRAVVVSRVRADLAQRLPAYMIPARIVVLDQLPVNVNGKLDGHALNELAEQALSSADSNAAAETPTEIALSEVFAELFDGRAPGIDADFYELGVDSIVAISLVNKARRRGLALNPRMVLACPTIRELAAAVDDAPVAAEAGADSYGVVPPLPVVSWMYEYGNYRRFTQTALLRLPTGIDRAALESTLQALLDAHDTLRAVLTDTPDGPRMVTRAPGVVTAGDVVIEAPRGLAGSELDSAITEFARLANDAIDPRSGEMVRAVWFAGAPGSSEVDQRSGDAKNSGGDTDSGSGDILLLAVHHLAVDVVSWHIMIDGLAAAWQQIQSGVTPKMLPEFTSYRQWSELMWQRAGTPEVLAQRDYWVDQVRGPDAPLGSRRPAPASDTWSSLRVSTVATPVEVTRRLLDRTGKDEGVREFLLTALTMTMAALHAENGNDPAAGALIALEGHGRADTELGTDTANTLGWFTSVFPVRLGVGEHCVDITRAQADPGAARSLLDSVTEHLREIPNQGLDYGLLRYVARVPELGTEPQVEFNYLGRIDLSGNNNDPWSLLVGAHDTALPLDPEPDLPLRYAVDVIAGIGTTPEGPALTTNFRWSAALFTEARANRLAELWAEAVRLLAAAL